MEYTHYFLRSKEPQQIHARNKFILSYRLYAESFSGMDSIKVSSGPMGTSVDGLALWLKTILTEEFYQGESDPYVKLTPFDDNVYGQYQKK